MDLYEYKAFQKAVARMARKGGAAEMAYREVITAAHDWRRGYSTTLPRTKNGENRIPHAVKYDLHGFYRLLTVEHEHARILLFVGSHDEMEQWLDTNRGARFVVNGKGQIDFTRVDPIPTDPDTLSNQPPEAPRLTGPVLRLLPTDIRELLGLPPQVLLNFKLITFELLVDNEDAWEIVHAQPYQSDAQRSAVLDTIDHLRHGRLKQAILRVEVFADEATASIPAVVEALQAGSSTDTVANLSTLTDAEFEHRFRNSGYAEWLLFLHPEQQKHVDARHGGPARLIGVSGSGKTCVLIHRAAALATRYPGEKILVLVLNDSLRQLLASLVEHLCPEEQRAQIEIMRIYDYCHKAMKTIAPNAVINPYDEMTGEDLATCWKQFIRRKHVMAESKTLRDSIEAMLVEPWGYIHDELIWLRSGVGGSKNDRLSYLTTERSGRSLPFPVSRRGELAHDATRTSTGFRADARTRVIILLSFYEEYMQAGGLLDEDGVALMAFEKRDSIAEFPALRARCVLVDEAQDCSTVQLGVISRIPTAADDGLMLVGDPVQKVFPKQQHLPSAGIDIRGRAARLNTNYRNTREILDAAFPIIDAYRDKSPVPSDDILQPELACRNGPRPTLVICDSCDEQWECIEFLIRHLRDNGSPSICVGSPRPAMETTPRLRAGQPQTTSQVKVDTRLKGICDRNHWPVMGLEGRVGLEMLSESVIGARFEDMKGFEFRNVILVDLEERSLISPSIPADERWRVAFQLYVAMTRAQEGLWLFAVTHPAKLLTPLMDFVHVMTPDTLLGRPPAECRSDAAHNDDTPPTDVDETADEQSDPKASDRSTPDAALRAIEATIDMTADGGESDDAETLELPFDPEKTTTAQMLEIAESYRDDAEMLEKILLDAATRDCSAFADRLSSLRKQMRRLGGDSGEERTPEDPTVPWPPSARVGLSDGLSGKLFPYPNGMLSFMGYRVGEINGLPAAERRRILEYVFRGALPRVATESYTQEWGTPGSHKRLTKLTNSLSAFIRNAQRRGSIMNASIAEWQDDLAFVRKHFG